MRNTTVTEKYNAVLEGTIAKKEFVRQMRQQFPMFVSNFDGFDSTVQILKTRNMLFEGKKETAKPAIYDEKPALTYSLDALDRGIRAELSGHTGIVNAAEYLAAENKAKSNLEKNPTHYLDLMAGESNKVDKHDRETEVKRGAKDTDVFNGLKNATLKEGVIKEADDDERDKNIYFGADAKDKIKQRSEKAVDFLQKHKEKYGLKEDEEEDAKNDLDSYDHDFPHQDEDVVNSNPPMSEDAKKAILGKVLGVLKTKYRDVISTNIIKDFLKTHYQDLIDGADIEEEFEQYIDNNYEGPSDMKDGGAYIADIEEKQGKDHDGDGDIDGDDYMAAKDKAIKKAMGKDESYAMKRMQKAHDQDRRAGQKSTYDKAKEKDQEKEKQLKEAVKSIIKKTLINEAATNRLADWGEGYESFDGVKSVVIELENIVTEVEQFYDKIQDKIAKTFAKTSNFRNEEGLKIGAFIAPSLETAFNQDLRPVIKKGFTQKVVLPKVKQISSSDVQAARRGGEMDEQPKETVFTPNF
jgi:hypothetical protein